ncbi:MAG: HEAT repeat domain-containing protein [Deltaproteobacteria bacterium]|nr:HEAT repeat domain-containing protein [Deltaproteobacteria bacterium]
MTKVSLASLSDPDPERRHAALGAVASWELDQVTPTVQQAVVTCLSDEVPQVRHAALLAITAWAARDMFPPNESVKQLALGLTKDENAAVRSEAAVVLAMMDDSSDASLTRLLELLADPSALVRREAAAALGDLRADRARSALFAAMKDEDPDSGFEAAFALASLGDARGRSLLEKFLEIPRRRLDAAEGLRRLGDSAAIPALRATSSKLFLGWSERLVIWATLHWLGDEGSGEKVARKARSRNVAERTLAIALMGSHRVSEGASTLIEIARNPEDDLRLVAIRSLGELGSETHLAALEAIAGDERDTEDARELARHAIVKIRGP